MGLLATGDAATTIPDTGLVPILALLAAILPIAFLAVWCLAWSGLRIALARVPRPKWLAATDRLAVERLVLPGVVVAFVTLALLACMPGVTSEFGIFIA